MTESKNEYDYADLSIIFIAYCFMQNLGRLKPPNPPHFCLFYLSFPGEFIVSQ